MRGHPGGMPLTGLGEKRDRSDLRQRRTLHVVVFCARATTSTQNEHSIAIHGMPALKGSPVTS